MDIFNLSPDTVEQAELVAITAVAAVIAPQTLEHLLPNLQEAQHGLLAAKANLEQKVKDREEAEHKHMHAAEAHKAAFKKTEADGDDERVKKAKRVLSAAADTLLTSREAVPKAAESYAVAAAAYEEMKSTLVPAARQHYLELQRDKRSEVDLPCPTWEARHYFMVDTHDRRKSIEVNRPSGCKCEHMPVRHERPEGNAWCSVCQDVHRDGMGPHQPITFEQFLRRFINND